MAPISPISAYTGAGQAQSLPGNKTAGQTSNDQGSFGKLVSGFIEQTNSDQVASDAAVKDLVTGKTDNIQQVVLAVANAEMSFQLFMEIRNKLIDSYNELMRMQF